MTKPIEVITSSDQDSTEESLPLTTYYNYIKAWNIAYKQKYGNSENAFIDEISRIASNSKQPEIYKDNFDKGSYFRGFLTLQLMNDLPVDKYPELTFTANIWLPVLSYYAIHGVGLALIAIRMQDPPKYVTHRYFLQAFHDAVLRGLFPYPFNGLCTGGPKPANFSFINLDTSATEVMAQINLANPVPDKIDDFIGKSLSTTRYRKLNDEYKKRRMDKQKIKASHTRHNICGEEYKEICSKMHATSICDFLYRMRSRSNYANPIMYRSGTNDVGSACSHYKDLLQLTKVIIAGINTLIEFYLGKTELAKIKSELAPFETTVKDNIPFPSS